MKIYKEVGDEKGFVELIDSMGNDLRVVNAARVSFANESTEFGDKDKKLLKYLAKHHHSSPFEHITATFHIQAPLYAAVQHLRHRTFSYNMISRRYTDFDIQFYTPNQYRKQHKSNRQASEDELVDFQIPIVHSDGFTIMTSASERISQHVRNSIELFDQLIEAGMCKEQARGVLPQNIYTRYYVTGNLWNYNKFCQLRLHDGAQWEIRKIAEEMESQLHQVAPCSWGALTETREKECQ
jgi:thymidylate synthase (FAD)